MKKLIAMLALVLWTDAAIALTPEEIVVVVNRVMPSSVELGDYYCEQRKVPRENIVSLMLPRTEEMTREDYDRFLVAPLRDALSARKSKLKCILLMSGVPLRVGVKKPTDEQKAKAEELKPQLAAAKEKTASKDAAVSARGKSDQAKLQAEILFLEQRESQASVDSELMLLWWDNYPLARWILNPLHWHAGDKLSRGKPPVLLTARLDGPSSAIVKRLIDDAIAVEETGLKGNVYIDARGIAFDINKASENGGYGYGGFDESMRETAELFRNAKWNVTLDNKEELFKSKTCPDAALYCGWYSHGKYIDNCTFVKGAVAWHLASSEAVSIRRDDVTVWCPNLLKAGVAVTLGPVAEPYTVGFPKPAEYFGFLATGKYTLAEVHGRTVHFCSWMTTCIGDPLYTPFKKNKLWDDINVPSSPKAGRSIFR